MIGIEQRKGGLRMKKKWLWIGGVAVLLLVCALLYFRPMPLSHRVTQAGQLSIQISNVGVQNGDPYLDTAHYNNLTETQQDTILALLDQYAYCRTVGTLFSDGSLSGLGDRMLYLCVFENDAVANELAISSVGKIAMDGKTYKMDRAEQFIDQVEELLQTT